MIIYDYVGEREAQKGIAQCSCEEKVGVRFGAAACARVVVELAYLRDRTWAFEKD